MSFLDFEQIKADNPIDQVMVDLGLDLKQNGSQFRGKCPTCESTSDRNLVITPAKGVYFCFAEKKGGDQLQLICHIEGCSVKEAAAKLVDATPHQSKLPKEKKGFKPLDYLDSDHAAVEAVGFEPEDAAKLGIGYSPRGGMKGTVGIPIRLEDGTLVGYIGITEAILPKSWHF